MFIFLHFIHIEQSRRWSLFGVLHFGRRARIDVSLCDDSQAGVYRHRLVKVKHKVWVLDDIHPESKRHTARGQQQMKFVLIKRLTLQLITQ